MGVKYTKVVDAKARGHEHLSVRNGKKQPKEKGFGQDILSGGYLGVRPGPRAFSLHRTEHIREEKTHTHKQIRGIVPGLGGWQNFVYASFWGHSHFLWEQKYINKFPPPPPKIPGQSCEK